MSDTNSSMMIRWFEEIWNQNRRETIEELMPLDCVIHDGDSDIRGPQEFRRFEEAMRSEFADIRITPHQIVSEGDMGCLRWSAKMSHRATGKPIHTTGISIVRFRDGKFAEAWQNWDHHGVREQIEGRAAQAAAGG